MHPREAVRRLVEEGVVRGLDDARLDELRAECWDGSEEQLEEAGLLGILTFFYETVERGARDGFIWHADEFWHDTDDAVAELAETLRPEPGARRLYRQVSAREKISTARKLRETVLAVELERDDGVRKSVEARTLDDLVACFNAELRARGRTRRLIPLETAGEWQMYLAVELRLARRLVAEGALPVADLDVLAD
ncbi:MAG: hypothetical protein ACHQ17_07915, partial [Polyangia bacterium]